VVQHPRRPLVDEPGAALWLMVMVAMVTVTIVAKKWGGAEARQG